MTTFHYITSILQRSIRSELWRVSALGCAAMVALLLGMNIGYFVVLWVEWGAILGGFALAGSVFLFPATGRWLQDSRKILFVAGFALAGAGVSDLLNFPAFNSDIFSGLLIGMACGLVLSRIIWAHGLASVMLPVLCNPRGKFVVLLLVLLGIVFCLSSLLAREYELAINGGNLNYI